MSHLKLCQYNVENLFVFLDQLQGRKIEDLNEVDWVHLPSGTASNKPLKKVSDLAKVFKDINADIFMLCELGGPESLENFNRHFLDNEYDVYSMPSNSERGIDLGYLVRKNLPYDFEMKTNKDHTFRVKGDKRKFSRDVLELRVKQDDEILMNCLLVHLKSKLNKPGDFGGIERRKAELEALLDIYEKRKKKCKNIVVTGDFNGIAGKLETEPEFKPIYERTDLLDFHEIINTPYLQRTTHYYFQGGHNKIKMQLDYIMMSEALQDKVIHDQSFTYRYKTAFGDALPEPSNLKEKRKFPSDHYPLVCTIEI